jgi:hypothetical protein
MSADLVDALLRAADALEEQGREEVRRALGDRANQASAEGRRKMAQAELVRQHARNIELQR